MSELREEAKLFLRGSLRDRSVEGWPQPALDHRAQNSARLVGVRASHSVGDQRLLGGGPSSRRVETPNRFMPIAVSHSAP